MYEFKKWCVYFGKVLGAQYGRRKWPTKEHNGNAANVFEIKYKHNEFVSWNLPNSNSKKNGKKSSIIINFDAINLNSLIRDSFF